MKIYLRFNINIPLKTGINNTWKKLQYYYSSARYFVRQLNKFIQLHLT